MSHNLNPSGLGCGPCNISLQPEGLQLVCLLRLLGLFLFSMAQDVSPGPLISTQPNPFGVGLLVNTWPDPVRGQAVKMQHKPSACAATKSKINPKG